MPARNSSSRLTTPSALLKVASRNFFTRAASPPVPGGEHPRLMTFAHPKNLFKKTKFYSLVTQRHKGIRLKRTAAAPAFEIVEIAGEFGAEILVQGVGAEFNESGCGRAEFCRRPGHAIAFGGFGRESKNFCEPSLLQPGDGAENETRFQVGPRGDALPCLERGKNLPPEPEKNIRGVQ